MRHVIVYPGDDGFWIAECPSLPGCLSQGKDKEQAILNVRQAIQGYIAALEEDHLPVPEDHCDALMGRLQGKLKIKGNIFSTGITWHAQS